MYAPLPYSEGQIFNSSQQRVPIPKSLWARNAEYAGIGSSDDGIWAVFGTHEEVS